MVIRSIQSATSKRAARRAAAARRSQLASLLQALKATGHTELSLYAGGGDDDGDHSGECFVNLDLSDPANALLTIHAPPSARHQILRYLGTPEAWGDPLAHLPGQVRSSGGLAGFASLVAAINGRRDDKP